MFPHLAYFLHIDKHRYSSIFVYYIESNKCVSFSFNNNNRCENMQEEQKTSKQCIRYTNALIMKLNQMAKQVSQLLQMYYINNNGFYLL